MLSENEQRSTGLFGRFATIRPAFYPCLRGFGESFGNRGEETDSVRPFDRAELPSSMVRMTSPSANPPTDRPDIWYFGLPDHASPPQLARLPRVRSGTPVESSRVALRNLANAILVGQFDAVLFTTPWGTQRFLDTCSRTVDRARLVDALRDVTVIAGGPGVADYLESIDIQTSLDRPHRSSWREILVWLDRYQPVVHWEIALEATSEVRSLVAGLEARGALVRLWTPVQFDPIQTEGECELLEAIQTDQCRYVVMDQAEPILRLAQLAPGGAGPVRVVPKKYRAVASQVDSGPLVVVDSFDVLTAEWFETQLPRDSDR